MMTEDEKQNDIGIYAVLSDSLLKTSDIDFEALETILHYLNILYAFDHVFQNDDIVNKITIALNCAAQAMAEERPYIVRCENVR